MDEIKVPVNTRQTQKFHVNLVKIAYHTKQN